MHSRWTFTVWTLDTSISDNEVGASSRIHGLRPQLCYRRPRKDSGLWILDQEPSWCFEHSFCDLVFWILRQKITIELVRANNLSCTLNPRIPDLGSWILPGLNMERGRQRLDAAAGFFKSSSGATRLRRPRISCAARAAARYVGGALLLGRGGWQKILPY